VITGLFAADKGKKGDYRHNDIAKWAFGEIPTGSVLDPKTFLLPNLCRIDLYADQSVDQHAALIFHIRPVGPIVRHDMLRWDICLRFGGPLRGLSPGTLPPAYWWLSVMRTFRQVRNLAIHSNIVPDLAYIPLDTSGTCRIYIGNTSSPATDRRSAPRVGWDDILRDTIFDRIYARIFGAFETAASTTIAQADRKTIVRHLSSLDGCEHRQEELGAPKVENESVLWFAPDGYREGCMCGAETGEGTVS
jgi:hypothetical protein